MLHCPVRTCASVFNRNSALTNHLKIHNYQPGRAMSQHNVKKEEAIVDTVISLEDDITSHMDQSCEVHSEVVIVSDDENMLEPKPPKNETITPEGEDLIAAQDNVHKYECEHCGKKFSTKQKMLVHKWVHRDKPHRCEVCPTSFARQQELDKHRLSSHKPQRPYWCKNCGKDFPTKHGLLEHTQGVHLKNDNFFHCQLCNKNFSSRQGFLIHKRKHDGERPYRCEYCRKAFRDGSTRRKHERTHTGERPHACPLCTMRFSQKVLLREHVRWIHAKNAAVDDEGCAICAVCAKAFADVNEQCVHLLDAH